jgi:hypothetical protein
MSDFELQSPPSSGSSKRGQAVLHWVRWLLPKWWTVLALNLLINVLLLLLGQGFAQLRPGVL